MPLAGYIRSVTGQRNGKRAGTKRPAYKLAWVVGLHVYSAELVRHTASVWQAMANPDGNGVLHFQFA